jgi:hypothetical protein
MAMFAFKFKKILIQAQRIAIENNINALYWHQKTPKNLKFISKLPKRQKK